MSDIDYANRLRLPSNPKAPQGPSDEELNRVPPDPFLPPFGGSTAFVADIVAGPSMDPGMAASVLAVRDRAMGSFTRGKK